MNPSLGTILLVGLLAGASQGAQPPATVTFAPAVAERLPAFADDDRRTLEAAVDSAVERVTRKVALPAGVTIRVTFDELAPSHPTKAQLMANPALDPTLSHSLGGAKLTGEVRGAGGQVLATVGHSYYPFDLTFASPSLDAWADARVAIDQFADKLAAACRQLQRG